jgi:hypothetical protein
MGEATESSRHRCSTNTARVEQEQERGDRLEAMAGRLAEKASEVPLLQTTNAKLREALEWYAQEHRYIPDQMKEPRSVVHQDRGARACAALEGGDDG